MEPQTLHEMVEKATSLHPNRVAVREDTGSSRHVIEYKELWRVSCIIADRISSVDASSQFIAVRMDQCLLFPAVILGVLRQGCGFACIDPTWTLEKQTDLMKRLGISVLIHNNESLQKKGCGEKQFSVEVMGTFIYFETFNLNQPLRKCPHSMAYAVLTSGSTGDAKTVRVPHSSIVPNILSLRQVLCISHKDVIFLSSPSTFDPSIVDIFLALSCGASLLITSRSVKGSATSLLNVLFPTEQSMGVSVLQMTPSLFNRWSDRDLKDIVFGSKTPLRALILGGEPFPPLSKFKHYCQANAPKIYNIYGVTEVSVWASIFQVIPSAHEIQNILGDKENPVPLGQPLSDTFFEVRDCTSGSLIHSGCGELFVGSSCRICEVDDENCLNYCHPVYRATGDLVQVHPNGNTYYIGRKDRSIKRWGHRVNLENIEYIALNYPGIQSACCVWYEPENKLHLVVNAHEGTFSPIALQRHLLQCVGSEKALIPDEIIQVQDTSLTHHGKLDYRMVMKMLQTAMSSCRKDSVGKSFLELCARVLGVISVEDGSFLHLGGNSFLAMTLITQLENIFGDIPQDLPTLLLSGESLLDISEKFCHFYGQRSTELNALEPVIVDKEPATSKSPEGGKLVSVIPESNSNHPPMQTSDKLISFSLRGRTSDESSPCFRINQTTLFNVTMTLSWKQDLGKCIDASPLCMVYESLAGGIVIGSHSGAFAFYDGTTGVPRWSICLPDRIESSACPSLCGRYVYVGCYNGALYCICTISGKFVWSFFTSGMIKCAPALCNEGKSVIFGSYDFRVYCINAESGGLQWSSSFGERGSWIASPLIIDNLAILCSLARKTYAVNTSDGKVLWTVTFLQPIFSTPSSFSCARGTNIVVADVKGNIHCLRMSSGREVASWQAPGLVFAPLTIFQDSALRCVSKHLILVACYDQHMYALSVNDSTKMSVEWKINLGASIGSAPFPFAIRMNDNVKSLCAAVVNSAGSVFILSLDDGKIISQYEINSEVFSSPVVHGGRVYFGCRDNNMYGLQIK